MGSDNPTGADDQQETTSRRLDPMWIVGFVDGEGCFSVSIHRNPQVRRTRGWQLQPAFQVYQHRKDRVILEAIADTFGCGGITAKGPGSDVLTYSVWARSDLVASVIPFFERYQLRVKARDFRTFTSIVRSMERGEHLEPAGFDRVVRQAFSMNAGGKQRSRTLEEVLEGSSETAR